MNVVRNLNDELDNIIIKYDMDSHNSRFRKYKMAQRMIRELLSNCPEESSILLVDIFEGDIDLVINEIADNKRIFFKRTKDKIDATFLTSRSWSLVVITAFNGAEEIYNILRNYCDEEKIVRLYDYFQENQLCFGRVFYHVLEDLEIVQVVTSNNEYKRSQIVSSKESALEKLIFNCLCIRDFVYVGIYIDQYVASNYSKAERYTEFKKELIAFLDEVRSLILTKEGNIFIHWLDALDYGEEQTNMPYLKSLTDESLYFERAYTTTPFTKSTMQAIFLQKFVIDDESYKCQEKISIRNGETLDIIKDAGFDFAYFGFVYDLFEEELIGKRNHGYTPASAIHWAVLCHLVNQEKKMVYLIHDFVETHHPFFYPDMDKVIFDYSELGRSDWKSLQNEGKKYLDTQLEFMNKFTNDKSSYIYMSDHGGGFINDKNKTYKWGRGCHTVLFIKDKNVKLHREKQIFSYVKFNILMKYLIQKCEEDYKQLFNGYAKIQDIDYYNGERLRGELLHHLDRETFNPHPYYSFRGIVTDKEEYIHCSDGKEEYRIYPSTINRTYFSVCADRIEYLKYLAGDTFVDVYKNDKFVASRKVYQIAKNRKNRLQGEEEPGVKLFLEEVAKLDQSSIIAIRGGGDHTNWILKILGDQALRVSYIIDRNLDMAYQFAGPGLNLKLISPEDIMNVKIDTIIISSFLYRKEMVEEIKNMGENYKIIDIYEMLEDRGIVLNKAFYEENYLPCDYEGVEGLV